MFLRFFYVVTVPVYVLLVVWQWSGNGLTGCNPVNICELRAATNGDCDILTKCVNGTGFRTCTACPQVNINTTQAAAGAHHAKPKDLGGLIKYTLCIMPWIPFRSIGCDVT